MRVLLEEPLPGRTVTVTYQKAPSELASGDDLSDSGLADTARACIVYGALGRIVSGLDVSRAAVDTAVASEFADVQRVGTATSLANTITARYQLELQQEQARLRKTHPKRVRWSGR